MIVVDTYLVYCQSTECKDDTQKQFYEQLAEELIDNKYDGAAANGRRSRENTGVVDPHPTLARTTGIPRSGVDAHLTPTKRKRKSRGEDTYYLQQGDCRVCKHRTTNICSLCRDDAKSGNNEPWLCHTKKGSLCFATHMERIHGK